MVFLRGSLKMTSEHKNDLFGEICLKRFLAITLSLSLSLSFSPAVLQQCARDRAAKEAMSSLAPLRPWPPLSSWSRNIISENRTGEPRPLEWTLSFSPTTAQTSRSPAKAIKKLQGWPTHADIPGACKDSGESRVSRADE